MLEGARGNALRLLRLSMEAWAGEELPGIEESLEQVPLVTLGAGDVLIRPGEPHPHAYYNLRGALRVQATIHDRIVTTGIRLEGEVVVDVTGLGLPFVRRAASLDVYPGARRLEGAAEGTARYLVTALESSLLLRFDLPHLSELTEGAPGWGHLFMSYLVMNGLTAHDDLLLYRVGTPAERYTALADARPELLRRITQRELALLLGVSEAGLSRVVKRVNTGGVVRSRVSGR